MLLLIFGPPGSGKGVQGEKLSSKYNFKHISLGEVLREHVQNKTKIGDQIRRMMTNGKLVDLEIIEMILDEQFRKYKNFGGLILDGFPRDNDQVDVLNNYVEVHKRIINSAIFLDVPEEVSIQRIQHRALNSLRADDQSLDKIKKRLEVYCNETQPVYDTLKNNGVQIHHVDSQRSVENIFSDILVKLNF